MGAQQAAQHPAASPGPESLNAASGRRDPMEGTGQEDFSLKDPSRSENARFSLSQDATVHAVVGSHRGPEQQPPGMPVEAFLGGGGQETQQPPERRSSLRRGNQYYTRGSSRTQSDLAVQFAGDEQRQRRSSRIDPDPEGCDWVDASLLVSWPPEARSLDHQRLSAQDSERAPTVASSAPTVAELVDAAQEDIWAPHLAPTVAAVASKGTSVPSEASKQSATFGSFSVPPPPALAASALAAGRSDEQASDARVARQRASGARADRADDSSEGDNDDNPNSSRTGRSEIWVSPGAAGFPGAQDRRPSGTASEVSSQCLSPTLPRAPASSVADTEQQAVTSYLTSIYRASVLSSREPEGQKDMSKLGVPDRTPERKSSVLRPRGSVGALSAASRRSTVSFNDSPEILVQEMSAEGESPAESPWRVYEASSPSASPGGLSNQSASEEDVPLEQVCSQRMRRASVESGALVGRLSGSSRSSVSFSQAGSGGGTLNVRAWRARQMAGPAVDEGRAPATSGWQDLGAVDPTTLLLGGAADPASKQAVLERLRAEQAEYVREAAALESSLSSLQSLRSQLQRARQARNANALVGRLRRGGALEALSPTLTASTPGASSPPAVRPAGEPSSKQAEAGAQWEEAGVLVQQLRRDLASALRQPQVDSLQEAEQVTAEPERTAPSPAPSALQPGAEAMLNELRRERDQAEAMLNEQRRERDEAMAARDSMREERDRMQAELDDLGRKHQSTLSELESVRSELDQARGEAALQAETDERERAGAIEASLDASRQECERLKASLESLRGERDRAASREAVLDVSRQECERLRASLESLRGERDAARTALEKLRGEQDVKMWTTEAALGVSKQECEKHLASLEKLRAERDAARAREGSLDVLRRERDEAMAALDVMKGERERARKAEAALEALRRERDGAVAALEPMRGHEDRARTAEASLDALRRELDSSLAAMRGERGRAQAAESSLDALRREHEGALASLSAARGEREAARGELTRERARAAAAEASLDSLERARDSALGTLESMRGQPALDAAGDARALQDLQVAVDRAQKAEAELQDLKRQRDGATDALEGLRRELDSRRRACDAAAQSLESERAERASLEASMERLREQLLAKAAEHEANGLATTQLLREAQQQASTVADRLRQETIASSASEQGPRIGDDRTQLEMLVAQQAAQLTSKLEAAREADRAAREVAERQQAELERELARKAEEAEKASLEAAWLKGRLMQAEASHNAVELALQQPADDQLQAQNAHQEARAEVGRLQRELQAAAESASRHERQSQHLHELLRSSGRELATVQADVDRQLCEAEARCEGLARGLEEVTRSASRHEEEGRWLQELVEEGRRQVEQLQLQLADTQDGSLVAAEELGTRSERTRSKSKEVCQGVFAAAVRRVEAMASHQTAATLDAAREDCAEALTSVLQSSIGQPAIAVTATAAVRTSHEAQAVSDAIGRHKADQRQLAGLIDRMAGEIDELRRQLRASGEARAGTEDGADGSRSPVALRSRAAHQLATAVRDGDLRHALESASGQRQAQSASVHHTNGDALRPPHVEEEEYDSDREEFF